MIEGKIFYEFGEYSVSIDHLDDNKLEEIIRKLRGVVQLRRKGYTG